MPPTKLWPPMMALAGAAAGLCAFHLSAPSYLFHQGFPLDDAWIHAVYAREFARSFTLAYNPGIPATGETAPLWPIVLAPIHFAAANVAAIAVATKLWGFVLHAAACVVLALALGTAVPSRPLTAGSAAALAAFHPHLIAAAVSGMEVPLAEVVIAGVLWAALGKRRGVLLVLGAMAIGARPEVAAVAVLMPLFMWWTDDRRGALVLGSSAFAGAIAALIGFGVRSWMISRMPLPATFYAKANRGSPFDLGLQQMGFGGLLGQITLLDSALVMVALLVAACVLASRPPGEQTERAEARTAVALYFSGMAFCVVSFALIPPVDPPAFYHQRYVLPGVMPAVASIPLLADAMLRRSAARYATRAFAAVIVVLLGVCAAASPARAHHLSNDAHNIDDVQVAFGRALAAEAPSKIVWAVDAGAVRYFGRPFVVDTIGLNTPAILGADAQTYLDAHPPAFLDVFPGWSRIDADEPVRMPARAFEAQTPYTVTSAASMRAHVLVTCVPPGFRGRFAVRARVWGFRCSS